MPCRSDDREPSSREKESQKVNQLIVYLMEKRGNRPSLHAETTAKEIYGDTTTLDADTEILCDLCKLTIKEGKEDYIWNGRHKMSRQLADWWENHQEVDKQRIKEEKLLSKIKKIKERIKSGLTEEEIELLGWDWERFFDND